jgi:hypothetical protein
LSKGLDVGHIQIQTTFYKIRVKKCSLFLASSTFFKYAQNEGFALKKLTGDIWATRFLNLGAQMATAYKS